SRSGTGLDRRRGYRQGRRAERDRLRQPHPAQELPPQARLTRPARSGAKEKAMTKANWNYPTSVRFGAGRIAELPDALAAAGIKRPLLVTDAGLANLPVTQNTLK